MRLFWAEGFVFQFPISQPYLPISRWKEKEKNARELLDKSRESVQLKAISLYLLF